jgi:hypothetical protein
MEQIESSLPTDTPMRNASGQLLDQRLYYERAMAPPMDDDYLDSFIRRRHMYPIPEAASSVEGQQNTAR